MENKKVETKEQERRRKAKEAKKKLSDEMFGITGTRKTYIPRELWPYVKKKIN